MRQKLSALSMFVVDFSFRGGSDGTTTDTSGNITNPVIRSIGNQSGLSFFGKFIPNVITLAFVVGAIIFTFMLVIGGVQWIASGGDKGSVESARGRITNALIGLVILFSTFAIAKLIENFFGVKILTLDIAPLVIQ